MGIYWQLCAVYCMSRSCARGRMDRHQYRDGYDDLFCNCCGLVDCSVCDVSERTMAVLVSGNSGGNVPGRNPGTFQILFYQDHTCRENRRIFWTYGHMWERRFLPWYDRDQPCFTINRASKYRSGSDFVVFYIGHDRI